VCVCRGRGIHNKGATKYGGINLQEGGGAVTTEHEGGTAELRMGRAGISYLARGQLLAVVCEMDTVAL